MITVCDNGIAGYIEQALGFDATRVIYGTLESARNHWVRRNHGKESLPYMSFLRRIEFDDEDRGSRSVDISTPGGIYRANYCKIRLSYTLEHVCNKVSEQTALIKNYIFWSSNNPVISVPDTSFNGADWVFPVEFESPEDSSDLEAEEETGRIVRTTFNFSARTVAVNFDSDGDGSEFGLINEILSRIHCYDGVSTSGATEVARITLP